MQTQYGAVGFIAKVRLITIVPYVQVTLRYTTVEDQSAKVSTGGHQSGEYRVRKCPPEIRRRVQDYASESRARGHEDEELLYRQP